MSYVELPSEGVPIKAWVRGVPVADNALAQLGNAARLPVVFHHLAVMPDVHLGIGATIGSVIPTVGAIVPAAVGVDIGCGMHAVRTTLAATDLPDDLKPLRASIEKAIPHGRTLGRKRRDKGSWGEVPKRVADVWKEHLAAGFARVVEREPRVEQANHVVHLGTLGTGNHFVEVCLDEDERVWLLLHSGSRGVGNRIATIFIEHAKRDMGRHLGELPDADLAYLEEGSEHFEAYVEAVSWAQEFARHNRRLMMEALVEAVARTSGIPPFRADAAVVDCHHNYVRRERHFGRECPAATT